MSSTRPSQTSSKSAAKSRKTLSAELEHRRKGLEGISEAKVPFSRLHCHDHIEVSINEHAPVVAMFGGQRVVLPPDRLVVFWAARPHGPIETAPGGWAHGIHIPLASVLAWRLPSLLMRALFAGRVILDPPGDRPASDLALLRNWVRLLAQDSDERRRIVLLEAEARLRRLAADLAVRESSQPAAAEPPHSRGALGRFEKMATLIARHFHEPLLIQDIAEAVHLTPDSAMRLFRRLSGITLHECLLQHRVSNAQRLLATTDVKIDDVAAQSGFGSAARFYASFQKVVGQSPAAYRRAINS
jgi:AraC family transcriptional regulator, melibiose operon regulatory protein